MDTTDSVDTGNIEGTREGPSIGPNKTIPSATGPRKANRILGFHMKQRNYETFSRAFKHVAVIDDEELGPLSAW